MLEKFLDEVCSYIRSKSARKEIRAELTEHINDLINDGKSEKEAIEQMGDCAEIGNRLDKQHRPLIEWSLIGLVAFIAAIGLITSHDNAFLLNALLGIAVCVGVAFFDYSKMKKLALPLYIAAICFLIFGLTTGPRIYGVMWARIWDIKISASVAALPFILSFAGFTDKLRGDGFLGIFKLVFLGIVSVFMLFLVPSMSTALIMLACYAVLLFTAIWKGHFGGNVRLQKITVLSGCLLFAAFLAFALQSYQIERILSFISADKNGNGWRITVVRGILATSSLFGANIATVQGLPANSAVPMLKTDFALVNVIVNLGWAFGIALITAVAAFIARLFVINRRVKNEFGFYLSLAACAALSAQFAISVLLNLGLFPTIGVALPFVTYGGTSYVVNMALVGIILSVWRMNNIYGATRTV